MDRHRAAMVWAPFGCQPDPRSEPWNIGAVA
jgi:hypothetical protein